MCGTTVLELVGPEKFKDLFVRGNLRCNNPVETLHYSVGYVNCCTHCGTRANLNNVKDEYPMCNSCMRNKSNKPVVRRQSFNKKTSK